MTGVVVQRSSNQHPVRATRPETNSRPLFAHTAHSRFILCVSVSSGCHISFLAEFLLLLLRTPDVLLPQPKPERMWIGNTTVTCMRNNVIFFFLVFANVRPARTTMCRKTETEKDQKWRSAQKSGAQALKKRRAPRSWLRCCKTTKNRHVNAHVGGLQWIPFSLAAFGHE